MQENISSNTKHLSKLQSDISKILQRMTAMENVGEEVHKRQDVLNLQKDVSNIQSEISNMQRGLTFVYGKNNVKKKIGANAN